VSFFLRAGDVPRSPAHRKSDHDPQLFPAELAVIDGGMREFFEKPAKHGAGCRRRGGGNSLAATYPNLRDVLGAFGDSRIGLHVYQSCGDLRAGQWSGGPAESPVTPKNFRHQALYCGPHVVRPLRRPHLHPLAPTHVPEIDNYAGESDPGKLPLVLAP